MLQAMRQHARYFYVLFFIIIITFVFWGVGTQDKERALFLAEIGSERVTSEEFWRAYERQRDFYRQMGKADMFDEIEKQTNLKAQVLNSLVEERVLLVAANDMGLGVSDQELQQAIVNDPRFMRDGVFKQDIYLRTLALNRLTPQYYENVLRNQIAVTKMKRVIIAGVDVSDADLAGAKVDKGGSDMVKQIVLMNKRNAAVKSFVEGTKEKLKVKINMEAINS